MSVQFMIHSFEALIDDRSLRLAIFRELLKIKTPLKDRIGIVNRAYDWSKQFQLHATIPPLDLRLFA